MPGRVHKVTFPNMDMTIRTTTGVTAAERGIGAPHSCLLSEMHAPPHRPITNPAGPPTITTASLARHRIIRTDGSHPTVGTAGSHRTIATVDIRQASTTVGSPPDLLLIETITSATRGIPHPAAQRDGVPLLVTMMTGLPLTTMTMTLLLIQVDADPPQHDRAVKDRDKMTEIST
uniref:Uncharacterized protein n=1 Tax=Knipowitschia caucasica TaxID=637954 RepID=A0AAV2JUX7_KNICA